MRIGFQRLARHPMKAAALAGLALQCGIVQAESETGFEAYRLWFNAGFYSAHFDTDKGLRLSLIHI